MRLLTLRAASVLLILGAGAGAVASAQTKPLPEVVVSPIECWWKTDRSAVRVGESFALTLTCAVLDTDKVKVVVDESGLAPAALHLVPFEILDGQRFRDIRNSPKRFFQYQYRMRILGEDFFGKEIPLPKLQLSYRVQNTLAGGPALAGREAQYSLNPVPIRVLSLVPTVAPDIRDTPPDTFGDVDARMFRSNLLLIIAAVALALALLIGVFVIVRVALKRRARTAAQMRELPAWSVLRAASRELSDVKSAVSAGGWTGDLAGRAAAALRLAAAVATNRPVAQHEAEVGNTPAEGQILLRRGLARKRFYVSGATTPALLAADPALAPLSEALGRFSAVRYAKNGTIDAVALDSALAEAEDVVGRLQRGHVLRMGRKRRAAHIAAKQSWAR
jgi:hypothetical protein